MIHFFASYSSFRAEGNSKGMLDVVSVSGNYQCFHRLNCPVLGPLSKSSEALPLNVYCHWASQVNAIVKIVLKSFQAMPI